MVQLFPFFAGLSAFYNAVKSDRGVVRKFEGDARFIQSDEWMDAYFRATLTFQPAYDKVRHSLLVTDKTKLETTVILGGNANVFPICRQLLCSKHGTVKRLNGPSCINVNHATRKLRNFDINKRFWF